MICGTEHHDLLPRQQPIQLDNRVIDHLHKNCSCGMATGTSTTLSKNCTTPPATTPDPRTIRETTLGLPGAAPDRCNNDRRIAYYRARKSAGAWVALPKEATLDSLVLRATTPEGASPIIGLVALHLQTSWLAPSFTSQLPNKGKQLTGY